jgi:hypothetical protein
LASAQRVADRALRDDATTDVAPPALNSRQRRARRNGWDPSVRSLPSATSGKNIVTGSAAEAMIRQALGRTGYLRSLEGTVQRGQVVAYSGTRASDRAKRGKKI